MNEKPRSLIDACEDFAAAWRALLVASPLWSWSIWLLDRMTAMIEQLNKDNE